ncbi:MAG: hypothetical protein JST64_06225 [Actinobacteria bacterium]|nr:hypothetical protein [Actinomycetota bacterium]
MRTLSLCVVVFSALALVACGSGGSTTSATTAPRSGTASHSTSTPRKDDEASGSTTTGSGAAAPSTSSATAKWPGAPGCSTPSAEAISAAFGATITQSIPSADDGCIWSVGPTHGVQVSYHPTGGDFKPARLALMHNGPGVTDIQVPGSTQAFIRDVGAVPNTDEPIAFVSFPEGVVQVAFTAPTGTLSQDQMKAVIAAIVG